jgi:hypothetical protein
MDGILINTIAYFLLSIGSYVSFDISVKHGSKFSVVLNYLLMCWSFFMLVYLVFQHDEIVNQPLNVMLNFYETLTNVIIGLYFISFGIINKRIKNN